MSQAIETNNIMFTRGLNELKDKLIDTSRRNKLINYKRPSKAKNLKIIDESPEFIFDYLVDKEKKFKFEYIPEPLITTEDLKKIDDEIKAYRDEIKTEELNNIDSEDYDDSNIKQLNFLIEGLIEEKKELQRQALLTPEERAKELGFNISTELPDIDLTSTEVDEKHIDDLLQTLHYPNEMEKILTSIERDAKSIIDETGSNMLYLVLGLMKWKESKNSEQYNNSPLISIPIMLTKVKKNNRYIFTLEYTGSGIDTNRSLAEKLNNDYGIILPELTEEANYINYLKEVSETIKHKKEWSLKQEVAVDFLRFGKILMYQDLKEENWKEGTPLSKKEIFQDIFEGKDISDSSLFAEEYNIDENKVANKIPLVMDADSSQHSAIVDILEGKNVVIEGPPGTGKSQTISNVIASLLAEGKSILFVSEKLAALEVVHKRLNSIGLSDFCLELHSNKSQKTKILESIKKRVESTYPNIEILNRTIEEIEHKKEEIQEYISCLHNKYGAIDKNIYNILWLVEKYNYISNSIKFDIPNANEYTHYKLSSTIEELKKYQLFLKEYDFNTFYWKGLDVYNLSFVDIDTFVNDFKQVLNSFNILKKQYEILDVEIDDEYNEKVKIHDFYTGFKEVTANKYSADILKTISNNRPDFNIYSMKFSNLEIEIEVLEEKIKELHNFSDLNENIILSLSKINKKLKNIRNETGLSKNKSYEFTTQLLKGIIYLSEIEEELYTSITKKYIDSSFSKVFKNLKSDLDKFRELKKNISHISKVDELDKLSLDEINSIQKIINEKKDSFFNFFSSEFKNSRNKINFILNDSLPSDKTKWNDTIEKLKIYISFKFELESNEKYKEYFGELFDGGNTSVENIKKLQEWVSSIRKDINILELTSLFTEGDGSKYSLLLSDKEELEQLVNKLNEELNTIENQYPKKLVKSFYYDRDDINILELKDSIELLNENLDTYIESIYEDINKKEPIKEEILRVIREKKFNPFVKSIQEKDIELNEISENFDNLLNISNILEELSTKHKIDLSIESNELINNTTKVYEYINNSNINSNIKLELIENSKVESILNEISKVHIEIETIHHGLSQYGKITNDFYGKNIKIEDCIVKLNQLDENKNILSVWINYRKISHTIDEMGLIPIVKKIESKELSIENIIDAFKYNFYNTLVKEIFRSNDLFNKFNRLSHEQSIKTFKKLDLQLIKYNKQRVAYLASQKDIPYGRRSNRKSELTEFSLVENELNKKTRHIPIRQLVSRAPNALQALKPCFMMSPLSVSQYLPPNKVEFDVLIVDEASQLRPEEALGSIARVKQIVIVGDPKQLPPTSFFDSMDKSDEEESVASESESILDICLNLYKPVRQLRWHYRSQHETLIDFSNQQFYDKNLIIFPSPSSRNNDELGIKYHYIENSVYQSSRNKVEAKIIVEHLENQMKKYPDKSIGVGTFNSNQRDLIQDLVDEREKESPVISNYINKWSKTSEPLFIKNIENLQGDERDVILISTTYGKDKDTGKVYQRFGPINSDTGWRRLNVLFTRSKQKMEIFTSMSSNDILISERSSRGVRALKAFLKYLESGTVQDAPEITGKSFDSEFEESVYGILKDCGFKSVPQVGVAGYFIDLAVSSEKNEHDFVLAIECDGATYHSSKSARDRDRLKQEVLERLGWDVYRIWSVDWYKNRENEIAKLIKAVKEAQSKYKGKPQSEPVQEIEVKEVVEINQNIEIEIKKEKEEHHHTEEVISQPKYSQLFLADEKIKEMLIELRDNIISQEFEIDRRCILSDMMIELFVKHKPINIDEFRNKIPKRYRDERIIHIDQLKYLNSIFDVLELGDE